MSEAGKEVQDSNRSDIGKIVGVDEFGDWIVEKGSSWQGMIFKSYANYDNSLDELCYVSELHDEQWTHQDFLDMCNGQEEIAKIVFDTVDWQSPETYMDESLNSRELVLCDRCDHYFWGYGLESCPHCGNKDFPKHADFERRANPATSKKIIIYIERGMVYGALSNFEDVDILVVDSDVQDCEIEDCDCTQEIKEFAGEDIFSERGVMNLETTTDPIKVVRLKGE